MSSSLEMQDRSTSYAAVEQRSSRSPDLTSAVLEVLFDVLPEGGLPAGTFCAMVGSDPVPGNCVVLIQLAAVHVRSRPAKRSQLAQMASRIQCLCFERHRVSITGIYWSLGSDGFQPAQPPAVLDERQRIDDATYLMLERAIREGALRHRRPEARRTRRSPRFA